MNIVKITPFFLRKDLTISEFSTCSFFILYHNFQTLIKFCTIWCYDIILLTDRNLFSIVRDPYFSGNIESVHGRFVSWYWRQWFSHFGCIGLNNYFYLWLVFCLTVTLLFLCLSAYKWQQVRYRLHIYTSANIDDVSVYRGFLVVV